MGRARCLPRKGSMNWWGIFFCGTVIVGSMVAVMLLDKVKV
jgi:hypothetical protein